MLGTSTRTSDVLINLGLNPLRWLREVGSPSPQFGVLSARAPPSPRCTALTAASCENHGAAPNFGTRVPGIFGGKVFFNAADPARKPNPPGDEGKRRESSTRPCEAGGGLALGEEDNGGWRSASITRVPRQARYICHASALSPPFQHTLG